MNICLLSKGIVKLYAEEDDLCSEILKKKYLKQSHFFQTFPAGGSQFWRGLHSVKSWLWVGSSFKVGSGEKIRFWDDVWWQNCPLKIQVPNIYNICDQQDVISEVCRDGQWNLTFRRNFGELEITEWEQMLLIQSNLVLTTDKDEFIWALERNKKFITKSMYHALTCRGVIDLRMMDIWKAPIPSKIKHFMWLVVNDRIQSADQLLKRREG